MLNWSEVSSFTKCKTGSNIYYYELENSEKENRDLELSLEEVSHHCEKCVAGSKWTFFIFKAYYLTRAFIVLLHLISTGLFWKGSLVSPVKIHILIYEIWNLKKSKIQFEWKTNEAKVFLCFNLITWQNSICKIQYKIMSLLFINEMIQLSYDEVFECYH